MNSNNQQAFFQIARFLWGRFLNNEMPGMNDSNSNHRGAFWGSLAGEAYGFCFSLPEGEHGRSFSLPFPYCYSFFFLGVLIPRVRLHDSELSHTWTATQSACFLLGRKGSCVFLPLADGSIFFSSFFFSCADCVLNMGCKGREERRKWGGMPSS